MVQLRGRRAPARETRATPRYVTGAVERYDPPAGAPRACRAHMRIIFFFCLAQEATRELFFSAEVGVRFGLWEW